MGSSPPSPPLPPLVSSRENEAHVSQFGLISRHNPSARERLAGLFPESLWLPLPFALGVSSFAVLQAFHIAICITNSCLWHKSRQMEKGLVNGLKRQDLQLTPMPGPPKCLQDRHLRPLIFNLFLKKILTK